jgi:hypothetical protein
VDLQRDVCVCVGGGLRVAWARGCMMCVIICERGGGRVGGWVGGYVHVCMWVVEWVCGCVMCLCVLCG